MESLNLLTDSNRLLREERDKLEGQLREKEECYSQLEGEVQPLRETNRTLTAQKDALVAEKTALRNEVRKEECVRGEGECVRGEVCVCRCTGGREDCF